MEFNIGDKIYVRAYKANGVWYRRWITTVEKINEQMISTISPYDSLIEDRFRGNWKTRNAIRAIYLFDHPYFILECYSPVGELTEIYINIVSPPVIEEGEIHFTDYELDVSYRPPNKACIEDEDEFFEAAEKYGYSEAFKQKIYGIAKKALHIAETWKVGPVPTF